MLEETFANPEEIIPEKYEHDVNLRRQALGQILFEPPLEPTVVYSKKPDQVELAKLIIAQALDAGDRS